MGILKATDLQISDSFKKCNSVKEIALKLKMSPKTIRVRLHRLGLRYPNKKKFSDSQVINEYTKHKSINIVAKNLGTCPQSVHERLQGLGCILEGNGKKITEKEREIIKNYYKNTPDIEFKRSGLLKLLPKGTTLNRLEHIVTKLGIGKDDRPQPIDVRKRLSRNMKGKEPIASFAGHHHTEKAKTKMAQASKRMWQDPTSKINSPEIKKRMAQTSRENGRKSLNENMYSRCKRGHYDINGKSIFFRSKWEPNYALYLDFMKKTKQIKDWEYEAYRFEFPIKRGCTCYTPDFKVINLDGSIEWHEVKGWMDSKSKTKLKRMTKYFPQEKIVLIDEKTYHNIKAQVAKMLNWY